MFALKWSCLGPWSFFFFSQGFCCSFNAHSNNFKSKASNENKREDSDYEDFINTEEFDDWDELEGEVEEEEREEMEEKEEDVADKPFTEMMRSSTRSLSKKKLDQSLTDEEDDE